MRKDSSCRSGRLAWGVPALLGVLALVTGIGCGGGGGGGGGPTAPPPPPTPSGINFTADAAAEDNTIFLREGDSPNNQTLVLEIRVKEVTDLYAVSFDLEFPGSIVSFDAGETEEGPWLSNKGKIDTALEITEDPDGTLIVGHSRLGKVQGRSGSGLLFTIVFTADGNGSGDFTITLNDAFSSAGEPMPDVVWVSGSITVST